MFPQAIEQQTGRTPDSALALCVKQPADPASVLGLIHATPGQISACQDLPWGLLLEMISASVQAAIGEIVLVGGYDYNS